MQIAILEISAAAVCMLRKNWVSPCKIEDGGLEVHIIAQTQGDEGMNWVMAVERKERKDAKKKKMLKRKGALKGYK